MGQPAEDGAHAARGVVARHLADLDVGMHAAEAAGRPAVEQVAQGDEGGGLTRLPRRVQHEVLLGPNQAQELIDVHAAQRRDGVVLVRAYRSCNVEEAHGPIMAPAEPRETARPDEGGFAPERTPEGEAAGEARTRHPAGTRTAFSRR